MGFEKGRKKCSFTTGFDINDDEWDGERKKNTKELSNGTMENIYMKKLRRVLC